MTKINSTFLLERPSRGTIRETKRTYNKIKQEYLKSKDNNNNTKSLYKNLSKHSIYKNLTSYHSRKKSLTALERLCPKNENFENEDYKEILNLKSNLDQFCKNRSKSFSLNSQKDSTKRNDNFSKRSLANLTASELLNSNINSKIVTYNHLKKDAKFSHPSLSSLPGSPRGEKRIQLTKSSSRHSDKQYFKPQNSDFFTKLSNTNTKNSNTKFKNYNSLSDSPLTKSIHSKQSSIPISNFSFTESSTFDFNGNTVSKSNLYYSSDFSISNSNIYSTSSVKSKSCSSLSVDVTKNRLNGCKMKLKMSNSMKNLKSEADNIFDNAVLKVQKDNRVSKWLNGN